MEWLQVVALGGTLIGVLVYFKNDSDKKAYAQSKKIDKTDERLINISKNISDEFKDFHGRMCRLEEKYLQMMERFMNERSGK